jgi:hypothetical protein
MIKLYLYEKEADGRAFYYVEIGSETHGRPTYLLWINRRLIPTPPPCGWKGRGKDRFGSMTRKETK